MPTLSSSRVGLKTQPDQVMPLCAQIRITTRTHDAQASGCDTHVGILTASHSADLMLLPLWEEIKMDLFIEPEQEQELRRFLDRRLDRTATQHSTREKLLRLIQMHERPYRLQLRSPKAAPLRPTYYGGVYRIDFALIFESDSTVLAKLVVKGLMAVIGRLTPSTA